MRLGGLEPGEGRTASIMLAHAFCMGAATVFFETAASALFLTRFDASAIPIVYIVAAAVSVVTGLAYSRLERHVAFWPLMSGTLVFLLATVLVFRGAIAAMTSAFVFFALFVWYRVISILTDLEYWAVASRLFDIRQAKRLFGFIGSGEVTARMLGAFAVPVLVRAIGTANLIGISAIALLACVVLVAMLPHDANEPARAPNSDERTTRSDRYVRMIIAVAAIGVLGKYFVDFGFLQQMQVQFGTNANRLASFFGIFSGATQALNLIIRVAISGPYLQRFGIRVGLQTLPAAHVICTAILMIVAVVHPTSIAVFWLIVANQGVYKTLKHPIDNPSIKVLYQPLRREERLHVQVVNEVIATPVAIAVAGGVMLLFTHVIPFDIRVFGSVMLLTFVAWIAATRVAWSRYVAALRDALQKHRSISSTSSNLVEDGAKSIDAIETALREDATVPARQRLLRLAGRIGGERATTILREAMTDRDERIREQALAALVNMRYIANGNDERAIETMIRGDCDEAAAELALHESLPSQYSLVRSALMTEVDRARNRVLLALSLITDPAMIERARRLTESSSRERRAYAAELLDASIPPSLRRNVLPLLGSAHRPVAHVDANTALRQIVAGDSFTPWTKSCAAYALDQKGHAAMEPTIERVTMLKSVDLFARTPDDVLAQIADEVETISVRAGEAIIRKGEIGDSLFIIARGRVRVHDNDVTIATLGECEIVGELAVLDPEPRSATVTAETDVLLYRLDRDDLFELLPDHIEIVRGIFHVLCARLRKH